MSNYIKNVAIVGAGGNSGSHITRELLKTGKHVVTAVTRVDSKSSLPEGVKVAKVDYSSPATIVEALRGQDALVITLSILAHDTQATILQAAADAKVPWVLPNEFSPDSAHDGLLEDVPVFQRLKAAREQIESHGKSAWLGVSCGFWYEWSMAIPSAFGFDFKERTATLFGEGETLTSVTTWPQLGRGVAALLSLPIKPESGNGEACLDVYRNKMVYINSFTVTQREMFDSALRVTGSKEGDWNVVKQPVRERYEEGNAAMQAGDRMGFVKAMYSRVFFPDDSGDFEKTRGTVNEVLDLPKEDMDEATATAIEMSKQSIY
ncbi:hypothetical protein MBLNU230_g1108t1 [Neophaeotheca triangularis]